MAEPPSRVRETDAFTLRMERDPLLRSTVTAVLVFDRLPDWDVLQERIDRATRLAPSFRSRLVPSPLGLAPPSWVVDPHFDLSWHLRHVDAPAPHTFDTVLEMARVAGMTAFDPARPLWEFTLIGGLAGGQAAMLMKVHHALTDGVGGIELAAHVVDGTRRGEPVGPMPDAPDPGGPGPTTGLGEAVGFGLGRWAGWARSAARATPATAWALASRPREVLSGWGQTAASIGRLVKPVLSTRSEVMTERRLSWTMRTLDVPFADLKAAGTAAGGRLNDAFLAGVTGGLRRYHERHATHAERLRVTMPINVRQPGDPAAGNRITLARFDVPVGVTDPGARIRAIHEVSSAARDERSVPHSEAVAGVLNLLPTSFTGGMLKHVDFLASNVPGFPVAVYVGGARVEAFYPFGPTIGAAANITLMSYRDTCNLGVTMDLGAVTDPDAFLECLEEGFEEVLAMVTPPAAPRITRTA